MPHFARLATVGAAAVTLMVPAAAHAYEADDYTTSISSPSITAGGSFTVVARGPEGNPEITLTITSNPSSIPASAIVVAGTKSLRKSTVAGVAEFTVTLGEPGKYTVVPTDIDGVVLSAQTITVRGEDAAQAEDGGLPSTGSDAGAPAVVAVGIVIMGALGVLVSRFVRARRG